MEQKNLMYVRPISWSSVTPGAAAMRKTPTLVPSIQIFGYTQDGRTIYVRIPRKSTFILRFTEEVDDEMVTDIMDILNPIYVDTSYLDPNVMIARAPELSPIELSGNPDYEGIATWTEVKQDPYGELESFWEANEIGPYEWISIEKFSPLPGKYTTCDLNIMSDETYIRNASDVEHENIQQRLFFWDIETFASKYGEFPNSSNPEDVIFMISIITVSGQGEHNGYVIASGDVKHELVKGDAENMVLIRARDEREVLLQFFAIYNTFKPDCQIYYNGDMFDMPYLLNRMSIHGLAIPKISKILSLTPRITQHQYPTPFGREMERTVKLPGTEIHDLLHYYRRFYPHLRNHRLDTVASGLIGEGKTDLTIDEMMDAVRTNDPEKLSQVVEYSYVDSFRMFQLWNHEDGNQLLSVQGRIESVCNNLGVSANTLLRDSFGSIINLAAYNIDAGAALAGGTKGTPSHLKEAVKGIYRNVYIYDYSELYRMLLVQSDQHLASTLGERLEGAPPQLILEAFYCKYVDRTELLPMLQRVLDSVIGTQMVIAIEPTIIRTIGPLTVDWLKMLDNNPYYVSVAKASYIILNGDGDVEKSGLSKLCRPKFELASDIIEEYLTLAYSNNLGNFRPPNLETLPMSKFILTEKIGDVINLSPDSIKYKLAAQYGSTITTWVSVKYLMTERGPVLLSSLETSDSINYTYYQLELAKYIKDLNSLKLYGVNLPSS